jgi:sn-glycerol 3-phosphate transport system substrate-binding protein
MLKRLLLSATLSTILVAPALAADRVKFDFWHGLTGNLGEVVAEVCKRFNDSQSDFEIVLSTRFP